MKRTSSLPMPLSSKIILAAVLAFSLMLVPGILGAQSSVPEETATTTDDTSTTTEGTLPTPTNGTVDGMTDGTTVDGTVQSPIDGTAQLSQDATVTQAPAGAVPTVFPAPMITSIDEGGNILIRGIVRSVGSSSLTIDSWGGTWTIRTAAESNVIPAGTGGPSDLSAISVNDFIGVSGTIAPSEDYVVDADFVRDWTTDPYIPDASVSDQGATSSSLSSPSTDEESTTMSSDQAAVSDMVGDTNDTVDITGAVSNVDTFEGTLTLTDSGDDTDYTVIITRDTMVLDGSGATVGFEEVDSGNTIRVMGTQQDNVITAERIENLSL